MPDTVKNWLGLALVASIALVLAGIAAAAVVLFGFAWAVLVCLAIAALIYRWVPTGTYGEGSFVIVYAWILLAIGLVVGLVARLFVA